MIIPPQPCSRAPPTTNPMQYQIEQQKPLIPGSLEYGTAPVMQWVPQPHYGIHLTRFAAMRSFVEDLEPEKSGFPEHLIRAQWRAWTRSWGVRTAVVRPSAEAPKPCVPDCTVYTAPKPCVPDCTVSKPVADPLQP